MSAAKRIENTDMASHVPTGAIAVKHVWRGRSGGAESLGEIPISLREIHEPKREIGISLKEIGISSRELPVSPEETGNSLRETPKGAEFGSSLR